MSIAQPAGRLPSSVLVTAAVVALSFGAIAADWYSFARRQSSAPGEYPIRIVLPEYPNDAESSVAAAQAEARVEPDAPGDGALSDTGEPLAAPGPKARGDVRLAESDRLPVSLAPGDLLAIHFDLADPDRPTVDGSAIEIRKAIRLNGADAGDARIHVDANSRLSIAREELGRLLARLGRQELMGQLDSAGRFVSFDEMRRQGIEVRYDPVSDRVLVST